VKKKYVPLKQIVIYICLEIPIEDGINFASPNILDHGYDNPHVKRNSKNIPYSLKTII
jgi:hypothetical protein